MTAREVFDAIVVGSGAAGAWAAKELTEQGVRVLLVEAGRDIHPDADFPDPPPTEHGMVTRLRGGLTGQQIQARCTSYSEATRAFYVDDRRDSYTTARGRPFLWFRGRQLGGRLHTWARLALRMSDIELKAASRDGSGVDWPIGYADLAPYYDHVERFLGIDGARDGLEVVPDARTIEPIPPTAGEVAFIASYRRRWPDRPLIAPRVIRHNPARIPMEILAAKQTGRLEVRTGSVVDRVLVDPTTGMARGVGLIDTRSKARDESLARIVFICASTIETVRIMLNSTSDRHPRGLGNSSGVLGRYLMDHTMVGVGGAVPRDLHQPTEPGADRYDFGRVHGFLIPRFHNLEGSDAPFLRGFHVQGAVGRGWPGWWLLSFGEVLPAATNAITLDPKVKDAWGVPVARIDYSYGDNELRMIAAQRAALHEICRVAGLDIRSPGGTGLVASTLFGLLRGRVLRHDGAFHPGASIHEVGGARMGDDPRTSVLNDRNQCWDSPNVFVTDGACFPSSGSNNGTLTIMALTARACEFAADELRRGGFG